jgi:uncharacterized membrane protein
LKKYLIPFMMFFSGGFLYVGLELLWRHYSHWSMFLAGGCCFTLIDFCNQLLKKGTPLWVRCTVGAVIITAVEFVSGCFVNLLAHWDIWDYSRYKINLMGQICLIYTMLWFFLTMPVLWLAKVLHQRLDQLYDHLASHPYRKHFLIDKFNKSGRA